MEAFRRTGIVKGIEISWYKITDFTVKKTQWMLNSRLSIFEKWFGDQKDGSEESTHIQRRKIWEVTERKGYEHI